MPPLPPGEWRPAHLALLCRRVCTRIRFVICISPRNPAPIAAKPPLLPRPPLHLEFLPAVRANPLRPFPGPAAFRTPFCVVFDWAPVAAEPSPFPALSALLYLHAALWADVHWNIIISSGIVIFLPAGITAKLLPGFVTGRLKFLPAV